MLVIGVLVLNACKDDDLNNSETKNEIDQKNNSELQDELNLHIGESGLAESELGKAKITLESVELVDKDALEEDAKYAPLFVMHVRVQNVGEESFSPEEVLSSGLLLGPDDDRGMKWMYYELSEEWEEVLKPDEETKGVIVFSHPEEEEYELIFGDKRSSSSHVVSSNKTSFAFKNSEIEEAE